MVDKSVGDGIVRVGPAGWSYEDWKGIVYPPSTSSKRHPLELLCRYFDTIEVNSSFYRPLDPKFAVSWLKKTAGNPRFVFTVKLWERYTHKRDTWPSEQERSLFIDGIDGLAQAGKLGVILAQFPWSFKRNDENRKWLAKIVDTFRDYPLSVELRHESWDREEVYTGLKQRGVVFCNIDQPIFKDSIKPSGKVTAPVAYVRFHGRNRKNWFRQGAGRDERYNYIYSEEELKPWIEKIKGMRREVDNTFVITNNHYRGQAVVNAFEIQHVLDSDSGSQHESPPAHLVEHYPRLKRLIQNDDSI